MTFSDTLSKGKEYILSKILFLKGLKYNSPYSFKPARYKNCYDKNGNIHLILKKIYLKKVMGV